MAAAYSTDIRQKILSAWQNKERTQRELAARFTANCHQTRNKNPSPNPL